MPMYIGFVYTYGVVLKHQEHFRFSAILGYAGTNIWKIPVSGNSVCKISPYLHVQFYGCPDKVIDL